ncbi:hypothetical protein CJ030_MR1G002463 [Morella rubra]|uniref:Disease resistance RPP13-like protein 1 n=1 Tax=Morella rubra TaxID=262757 RepID=A0A6A1WK83_9ROSI|nr:hypothetical protein CJ030_MR1G002463 [Morella rubra]
MEEIGEDYFHDLVSRSLFQRSVDHDTHFVIHDLINDLAKFVSGQFNFRLNVDKSHEGFPKTRYLSYMRTEFDTFEKFEAISEAKQLRTFLPLELAPSEYRSFNLTKKVLRDLLPSLRCLRVLSLSHYRNMTELSDSVGKMKHLRYLDISFTMVRRLPESICQLCNLQTLKLSGCKNLIALPRDMERLVNLRHLDITETGIKEMPMHLGNLKCLRTLPKFIVSKHRGSGSDLGELGKLANLRGALSLWELQNVESPQDALDANLKNRKYLPELALFWNDSESDADISGSQKIVLDNLRPHPNLKSLTVNGYSGERFPDWVGHDSFSNIASLHLKKCKYCCSLPSLGQLHSLQNLSIEGFDGIVTVGSEFYGIGSSSIKPFGSLKVLKFMQMSNWETWFPFGAENEDVAFPSLEELYIRKCPKLKVGFSIDLPSLAKLEIDECPQLVISLREAPVIRELQLIRCNEGLLKELPVGMQRLRVEGFDSVESLPEGLSDSNSCLRQLEISDCSTLVSLLTGGPFSTLKKLQIRSCISLENCKHCCSMPPLGQLHSLQNLSIVGFPEIFTVGLEFYGTGSSSMKPFGSLKVLIFKDMLNWETWFHFDTENEGGSFPSLGKLNIKDCPKLTGGFSIHLTSLAKLEIENCPQLVISLRSAPILRELKLMCCNEVLLRELPVGMEKLRVEGFDLVESLSEGLMNSNICLQELKIKN